MIIDIINILSSVEIRRINERDGAGRNSFKFITEIL